MIKLRTTATAYLMHNGSFLMMKRSDTRKFAPGIWAGVGGHLEPDEVNDPQSACLREVFEETGIYREHLSQLGLRYVILRRSADEIRVQYIFFANSDTREVITTDEGELHWISESDLLCRDLSVTTRASLDHFLQHGRNTKEVYVGTVSAEGGKPITHWNAVEDWEGF